MDAPSWDGTADEYLHTQDLIAYAAWWREDGDEEQLEIIEQIDALETVGIADWQYGEMLIRDDSFKEYAQELAEDIGAINRDAGWPMAHIDWEAAADALKQDYTEVEFLGHTYWVRA